ncbi:MAG: ATP-binding protein [Pseudomonadota bacterium]
MKKSITFKTLLILSLVIISTFVASAYLFSQSDNKLINDIRSYNLNQAMKALDARLEARLALNAKLMQDSVDMIAKNSSTFLLNFDSDGLQQSLLFDIKNDGIQAIKVWDEVVKENFLTALKVKNKIVFKHQVPKEFEQFIQLNKAINNTSDALVEKIGDITLYYDESLIINQINQLKNETKKSIERFNQAIDAQQNKANIVKFAIAVGLLLTILVVMAILLMNFVNKPLKILESGLNNFFLFLQNKKDHPQQIVLNSNDEFGSMAKSLNENISVSARLHAEIHELNTNLEQRIEEKTTKVTMLLNNADQGFLSFSKDLLVDGEYSKECVKIFKKEILGLNIADLLYENSVKKDFFIETLQSLLEENNKEKSNKLKIKTIISLLQNEFIINKKAISVKYKIVAKGKFMLIFTDITAKKILEKKINREKNILKMIVAVVSDSEEFFELYDEFEGLIQAKSSLIDQQKTPLHNATELYRLIHTFKGLFAQKEMNSLVANLHKLESSLSDAISSQENCNEKLQQLLDESDFESWLLKDITIIKDVLGDELFSKRGKVSVDEESISQIEGKIVQLAQKHQEQDEYKSVVKDIRNLKNRTLYSLFSSYPKLVDQLSTRLGKSIYPLEIIVDKEIKCSDELKPLVRSLVHIFRNSVDHGIESMDERLEINKDEIGTISCSIKQTDRELHIIIADDGAGLDLEQITQKAKQLSINIDNSAKKDIEALIFNDGFSTSEEVSQTSGRGVGMAVVKHEVEQLKGSININSQKDIGTSFEIKLPNIAIKI